MFFAFALERPDRAPRRAKERKVQLFSSSEGKILLPARLRPPATPRGWRPPRASVPIPSLAQEEPSLLKVSFRLQLRRKQRGRRRRNAKGESLQQRLAFFFQEEKKRVPVNLFFFFEGEARKEFGKRIRGEATDAKKEKGEEVEEERKRGRRSKGRRRWAKKREFRNRNQRPLFPRVSEKTLSSTAPLLPPPSIDAPLALARSIFLCFFLPLRVSQRLVRSNQRQKQGVEKRVEATRQGQSKGKSSSISFLPLSLFALFETARPLSSINSCLLAGPFRARIGTNPCSQQR